MKYCCKDFEKAISEEVIKHSSDFRDPADRNDPIYKNNPGWYIYDRNDNCPVGYDRLNFCPGCGKELKLTKS